MNTTQDSGSEGLGKSPSPGATQSTPGGPTKGGPAIEPEEEQSRLLVEIDDGGKGRLRWVEGNATIKTVALNTQGFNALIEQDFMRKPHSLKVGALNDWVELDGELFRFQKDAERAAALEAALNQHYVLPDGSSPSPNVAVFANPASPTGFDLQFPAYLHGIAENRRRHLNEETIGIMQNPEMCRVLRKGTTITLAPPQLVFRRMRPDGSDTHFRPGPGNTVSSRGDDGQTKEIDLSQPVELSHVSAGELAAIFNHPAINRRARLATIAASPGSEMKAAA